MAVFDANSVESGFVVNQGRYILDNTALNQLCLASLCFLSLTLLVNCTCGAKSMRLPSGGLSCLLKPRCRTSVL